MSNYKIYMMIALGLAGTSLVSCTADFLDVESKVESTTGNFYRTEEDAYHALIGCYDGWQCVVSNGITAYMASEMMSDECFAVMCLLLSTPSISSLSSASSNSRLSR